MMAEEVLDKEKPKAKKEDKKEEEVEVPKIDYR
jgi:hypothetical protein